jgi:hypothetical protein
MTAAPQTGFGEHHVVLNRVIAGEDFLALQPCLHPVLDGGLADGASLRREQGADVRLALQQVGSDLALQTPQQLGRALQVDHQPEVLVIGAVVAGRPEPPLVAVLVQRHQRVGVPVLELQLAGQREQVAVADRGPTVDHVGDLLRPKLDQPGRLRLREPGPVDHVLDLLAEQESLRRPDGRSAHRRPSSTNPGQQQLQRVVDP